MSQQTGIEWCDATWNPIRGCTRVSEGCRNCYAERVAARFSGPGQPYEGLATMRPRLRVPRSRRGVNVETGEVEFSKATVVPAEARWTGEVRLVEEHLTDPLRWRKPQRVFVNSMSDLFHEAVPDEWIDRIFAVMVRATRHTFQVLTKRPERMQSYIAGISGEHWLRFAGAIAREFAGDHDGRTQYVIEALKTGNARSALPLPNVWLGVSFEDQPTADARIPLLLQTPASVRFVSAEPLLGTVDLGLDAATCDCCPRWGSRWVRLPRSVHGDWSWADTVAEPGVYRASSNKHGALCVKATNGRDLGIKPREFEVLGSLDWLIVGGESGPGARPCDVAWIRSIVEQCRAAGVACFVKQLGAVPFGVMPTIAGGVIEHHPGSVRLRSRKGGDPSEWPEDLRVREFPEAR